MVVVVVVDMEVNTWPTFWDAFESSIHNNPKLAPIDKFNYLNSLLMKPALTAFLVCLSTHPITKKQLQSLRRGSETNNRL